MDSSLSELKKLHEFYNTDRFSKSAISKALDVDRRTLRRWLQGTSVPSEKHQKMIRELVEQLKSAE